SGRPRRAGSTPGGCRRTGATATRRGRCPGSARSRCRTRRGRSPGRRRAGRPSQPTPCRRTARDSDPGVRWVPDAATPPTSRRDMDEHQDETPTGAIPASPSTPPAEQPTQPAEQQTQPTQPAEQPTQLSQPAEQPSEQPTGQPRSPTSQPFGPPFGRTPARPRPRRGARVAVAGTLVLAVGLGGGVAIGHALGDPAVAGSGTPASGSAPAGQLGWGDQFGDGGSGGSGGFGDGSGGSGSGNGGFGDGSGGSGTGTGTG